MFNSSSKVLLVLLFILLLVSCEPTIKEEVNKDSNNSVITYNQIVTFKIEQRSKSFELYSDNQVITTKVTINGDGGYFTYEWYKKNLKDNEFIKVYNSSSINFESGKEIELIYNLKKDNFVSTDYFCRVIFDSKKYDSNIITVTKSVNTGLPTVVIETENNKELINKEDKINSVVTIFDETGNQIFRDTETTFSGRGNSTWVQPKKPYKIKLSSKESLFGLPKHKQWMLIANYLDMSFMKNEMAFFLSEELGMDWTIHGQYINLIKNGEYLGLYWLGEQIKVDENRVNIDEDDDYLIEMDIYYDEVWKFKSAKKNLPYLIKNDDSMTEERLNNLISKITNLENVLYSEYFPYTSSERSVYDNSYASLIDVDSIAKFYLVNEIMYNGEELNHPKSCYFTFDNKNNILKAGPVWDYDYSAWSTSTELTCNNSLYYDALFKTKEFTTKLNELRLTLDSDKVSEKIEKLKELIKIGALYDGIRWGSNNRNPRGEAKSSWDEYVSYLEDCIVNRLDAIKDIDF